MLLRCCAAVDCHVVSQWQHSLYCLRGDDHQKEPRNAAVHANCCRCCCCRPEFELLLLRQFQDAICDMLSNSQQQKQKPKQSISSSSPASKSFTRATSNIFGNSSSSNGHSSSSSTASAFALPANGTPLSLSSSSSSSENSTGSRDMVAINNNTALASPHSNSSRSKTLAVPNRSRSTINKCLKAWQSASPDTIRLLQGRYDYRLARFYMWTQTETAILLAVHLPTGRCCTDVVTDNYHLLLLIQQELCYEAETEYLATKAYVSSS